LVGMGPVAIGSLKRLREGQPAEAQKRIDDILKELDKQREKPSTGGKPATGASVPVVPMFNKD